MDRHRTWVGRWLVSAALAAAVAVAGCDDDDAPAAAMGERGQQELLVGAEWLRERLDDPEIQVLDVRDRTSYGEGHIPGARNLPVDAVRASVDGVPGQVVSPQVAEVAAREAGLRQGAPLVVYGDDRGLSAARMLWVLRHYGHEDVHRLDGDWPAWITQEGPVEAGAAGESSSEYEIETVREQLRVDAEWLQARLDDPSVTVVDVRSRSEYDDGHIPGARNIPWTLAIDDAGRMQPREQVVSAFDVPGGTTVVVYCTTGVRAAMGYFTFEWLGHDDVRLYDGSWAEWGRRDDLPVE